MISFHLQLFGGGFLLYPVPKWLLLLTMGSGFHCLWPAYILFLALTTGSKKTLVPPAPYRLLTWTSPGASIGLALCILKQHTDKKE
jgi:hypothetical protein